MQMKNIKITVWLISLILALSACNDDFLQKIPLDQVSSEIFFVEPNDMKIYMNQFYNDAIFPVYWGQILGNPYRGGRDDYNSDLQVSSSSIHDRLKGTRTVESVTGAGWNFNDVRSINYFFDNYKKCTADFDSYKQYAGEAHFFRAMIYFPLLQNFGDVPWYSFALETNSPELYTERTPRNQVADRIIADLDTAVLYLSAEKGNGCSRINKWIALALQARVALYEGSWEKYHEGDPFGVNDPQPDKYFAKAVGAAGEIMNSGLFGIYNTGHPESDYYDLFNQRDYSGSREVLFWKKFSTDLSINNNRNYRLEYPQGTSVTKKLADSYLCIDGNPISGNPLFKGYTTITEEMANRDPRFSQTIFSPDFPWKITTDTLLWNEVYVRLNSGQQYYAPTGYVLRKFYDARMIYHDQNFEETPAIHFRYAEVLLNFAEAKAELGTITQEDLDHSIGLLRARAGMPNLELNHIQSDPMWDFPDLLPVINEIRRERNVELATEGFRWPDIARWAAADELIVGKRPKGFKGSQIASTLFPVDENGFLDPFRSSLPDGYGFHTDRDYLDPIPLTQIVLNPKLVQNPGW